jgi:hypothetical protein
MTLKQFDVMVQDKPGEVAHVAEILAKNAVNIRGISTEMGGGGPMVHVITDDDASTRKALTGAGIAHSERDILVVSLPDKPGELAKITKKLARGGVNIESMFMLTGRSQMVEVAMTFDKHEEAMKILDYS